MLMAQRPTPLSVVRSGLPHLMPPGTALVGILSEVLRKESFTTSYPRQRCGRMAVSHSVKERTISENSLIILLQGLQGQVTTVDLRDESVAHGRIDNVDAFMNIRLAKVTYTDRWGHQVELDDLFVTGRNIRYVHIPDDVNITSTIEQQLQVVNRVRNFGSKGQGRREFPSKKHK